MAKRVKIPGRLESAETGNIVTGADAVMDDAKGKTQVVINSEVDAAIINLAQGKQDNLTFDSAPTEDSPNPVTSAGVYTADKVLSDAIEAILLLIPSAASALNKLVDMQTMNSSIATATASFKGTYNLVSDLHLGVDATHEQIGAALDALSLGADNNDYAFVQVPNSATAPTEISKTERYKYNGANWLFEYDLNNSGFTQGQWNAINSGVTSLLVSKLSNLPTNAELTELLAGKQDNLTFDNVPTAGSPNPVKSGGVYARNNEIVALINVLDAAKQDVLTFDNAPVDGSPNPVKSGGVYTAISAVQAAIVALDAAKQNVLTFDSTPTLGSPNPVTSSGIKTELNRIDGNITTLNDLYEALTQSALVVVQPSDTWPVASPATKTIYRVVDRVNTPPQYYSDYMWNGTTMVLVATYNNAIDDVPTDGSPNLVKSGGVKKSFNIFLTDVYGYMGNNATVGDQYIRFCRDQSKQKPSKICAVKVDHPYAPFKIYKVSLNDAEDNATVTLLKEVTPTAAGVDIYWMDVDLGEHDYIGLWGQWSSQYGDGVKINFTTVPATSMYKYVGVSGGTVGAWSGGVNGSGFAIGLQMMVYKDDVFAQEIAGNKTDIQANNAKIISLQGKETNDHVENLLAIQGLEQMKWDNYSYYLDNQGIYINTDRPSGKTITDIYYKTNGGETNFYKVHVLNGVASSVELLQTVVSENRGVPYIAHCKLDNPTVLFDESWFIAIQKNCYYSNDINDKGRGNVSQGEAVTYYRGGEMAFLAIDETVQGESVLNNGAIPVLEYGHFVEKNGAINENGETITTDSSYKNSGLVDVSSIYRIVASVLTPGVSGTCPAIILYDAHMEVVRTIYADANDRNCLFDIYLDKRVKYMVINTIFSGLETDYCYGYKRIRKDKLKNFLYKKKFNSAHVDSEFVGAGSVNFTNSGLLVNNGNTIKFNRYYSLQTRTIRLLCKFNSGAKGKITTDVNAAYHGLYFDTTAEQTQFMLIATQSKGISFEDFSIDHPYLIEITNDYNVNRIRITDMVTSEVQTKEYTNNGTGGSGEGAVGTEDSAGTWHDYYQFICEAGSYYIQEMNIVPLYGKVKTLVYGDSITELNNFPKDLYSQNWIQMFKEACAGNIMVSPRYSTTISELHNRIQNELPYIDAEFVMITIGTNGGDTDATLTNLIDYIFACGATPVLNHIPCKNIVAGIFEVNHVTVNALIDTVRAKYNIHGVDFDIPTSLGMDGQTIDTSKFWEDDHGSGVITYGHPNVKGCMSMFSQIKIDMPELFL